MEGDPPIVTQPIRGRSRGEFPAFENIRLFPDPFAVSLNIPRYSTQWLPDYEFIFLELNPYRSSIENFKLILVCIFFY